MSSLTKEELQAFIAREAEKHADMEWNRPSPENIKNFEASGIFWTENRNAYIAGAELLADMVIEMREALEAWLVFEREQVSKEGPYAGERITRLISDGEAALAKIDARGRG